MADHKELQNTIHLIIGKEEDLCRDNKTGCGRMLEDCGTGVFYSAGIK